MLGSLVVPEVLVSVEVLVVPEELVSLVIDLLQAKRTLCVQKVLPLPAPKVLDTQRRAFKEARYTKATDDRQWY